VRNRTRLGHSTHGEGVFTGGVSEHPWEGGCRAQWANPPLAAPCTGHGQTSDTSGTQVGRPPRIALGFPERELDSRSGINGRPSKVFAIDGFVQRQRSANPHRFGHSWRDVGFSARLMAPVSPGAAKWVPEKRSSSPHLRRLPAGTDIIGS